MLNKDEQLKEFFARGWPLLRVHYPKEIHGDVVVCSCSKGVDCPPRNKGKHPASAHGVNSACALLSAVGFGPYNAGLACGDGFVVVDIDPRNGGNETLAALEAKHGALPRTWLVATGGGGHHHVYSVPGRQESGNRYKADGVELKGLGSYVVAVGSLHSSGRYYEWEVAPEDCELAECPQWIIDECIAAADRNGEALSIEDRMGESEVYTREEVLDALSHIETEIEEKKWKNVAMALASGGFRYEDFLAFSRGDLCGKPSEKFSRGKEKACREAWNKEVESIRKTGGSYYSIGTVIHMAQEEGWHPKPVESPLLEQREAPVTESPLAEGVVEAPMVPPCEVDSIDEVEFPPGLAGALAQEILDCATMKLHEFAIVSSLSILAGCAQGGYRTPNGCGVLGSYSFIITESGGGKGDFIKPIDYATRKAFKHLVLGDPASGQALRAELLKCPSRIIIQDEGIKWLQKTLSAKHESAAILQGDYLTAWSGGYLQSIVTKESAACSPEIDCPTITVVGSAPLLSFRGLLREGRMLAEDGFLSRLDFVIGHAEEPDTFLKKPSFRPSHDLMEQLKFIAKPHRVEKHTKGKPDGAGALHEVHGYNPCSVSWGVDGADATWDDYARECFRRARSSGLPFVWSRTAEKALRIASLLAIADSPEVPVVSSSGLGWAIRWTRHLALALEGECRDHLDKSEEQVARDCALLALRKEGGRLNRNRIGVWARSWDKFDERVKNATVEGLLRDGLVTIDMPKRGVKTDRVFLTLTEEGRKAIKDK